MPAKNSRVNVYRAERAAKEVGLSLRQLRRITIEMGKQKSPMGSNRMYLYSDADLDAIRERHIAKANGEAYGKIFSKIVYKGMNGKR